MHRNKPVPNSKSKGLKDSLTVTLDTLFVLQDQRFLVIYKDGQKLVNFFLLYKEKYA